MVGKTEINKDELNTITIFARLIWTQTKDENVQGAPCENNVLTNHLTVWK